MPIGYLITVVLMAVLTFCAVAAPTPTRPRRSRLRHWLGFMINELPAIGLCWLLASTALAWSEGDLATPVGAAALALAVVTALGLGLAAWRGTRAGTAVDRALADGLPGDDRREHGRRAG